MHHEIAVQASAVFALSVFVDKLLKQIPKVVKSFLALAQVFRSRGPQVHEGRRPRQAPSIRRSALNRSVRRRGIKRRSKVRIIVRTRRQNRAASQSSMRRDPISRRSIKRRKRNRRPLA